MHCFASENQTYTGLWLLALSLVFKGQENLLLKNLQVKTRVENVRFLSWRIFFVGKYGIQSTNEMAFKRTVTLRASFRFPAIRFAAPTLLSFGGFTHAHAKCPPVDLCKRTAYVCVNVLSHCYHRAASLLSGRHLRFFTEILQNFLPKVTCMLKYKWVNLKTNIQQVA